MAAQTIEDDLRTFARVLVQAGLGTSEERQVELVEAVRAEMPHTDAEILARAWLAAAEREWRAEAGRWAPGTDHDRTQAAFAECEQHDLPVLAGVDDLSAVRARTEQASRPLRGVAWFTRRSVWDAVTEGVLEVEVRHADGRPTLEADHVVVALVGCLERHGVRARFHEGRVQVATRWCRRPS